jgi:Concanavalin A-like lectin/glucanases superfamily/Bacterial Ig-like domain (group 3)
MNSKYLKIFSIFAIVFAIILVIAFVVAESSWEDSQNELDNLIEDLNSEGYGWLVNYLKDLPVDSCQYVSTIENISEEGTYKTYLTNLNGSYDTFDLKVNCISENCSGIEFDYIVDPFYYNLTQSYEDVNVTTEFNTFTHLNIDPTGEEYLELDGVDDYVDLGQPTSLNFVGSHTYSAWFKKNNSISNYENIFGKGILQLETNGSGLTFYPNGDLCFQVRNDVTISLACDSTGYTDNQWHYVVGVRDHENNISKLYVDGVNVADNTTYLYNYVNSVNLGIGARNFGTWTFYFNGSIDEVMVYNRTLTISEINSLYALNRSDSNISSSDLVGEWNFDDDTNAVDSSGQGNDGTLEGGAKTVLDKTYSFSGGNGLVAYYPFDYPLENASWVAGNWSGALTFDGVDDYVNVGTPSYGTDFSISLWVNPKNLSSSQSFISADTLSDFAFRLDYIAGTRIDYYVFSKGSGTNYLRYRISGSPLVENTWYNIIITFENSTKNGDIYINGVNTSTSDAVVGTFIEVKQGIPVSIGAIGGRPTPTSFSNSTIDEVRIFDYALNSTEITELYDSNTITINPENETVGGNLITNGGFDTDSDWIKETGWSIADGKATQNGSGAGMGGGADIIQLNVFETGENYLVEFDVVDYTAGTLRIAVGSKFFDVDSNNHYSYIFNSVDGTQIYFRAGYFSWNGSIDNVSVQKIGDQRGYWKLDDGTGFNAIDSSGQDNYGELHGYNSSTRVAYDYTNNSNDGSAVSGASPTLSSYLGGAYEFDGVNDYVSLADVHNFGEGLTYSVWIKPAIAPTSDVILQQGATANNIGGAYLRAENVNGFLFAVGNGSERDTSILSVGAGGLTVGEWNHILVTANLTGKSIYVNGVLKTTNALSFTGILSGGTVDTPNLGSHVGGSDFFNGSMDEVMIFNRTLSSVEITKIYNASFERFYPTGTQVFKQRTIAAGNNTVNWSINGTQQLNGSYLQARAGYWDSSKGYNITDPSNGLVSYWPMDNSADNGTWVVGNWSGALSFDGVDDYVSLAIDSSLNYTKNISYSAWVKPYTNSVYQGIFSSNSEIAFFKEQYGMWFNAAGTSTYCVRGNGTNTDEARAVVTSDVGISVGTWVYVTCVINDTDILLYTNGVYRGKDPLGTGDGYYQSNLRMGAISSSTGFFNGSMDEVRIFNYVLNSTEISDLYNNNVWNGNGLNEITGSDLVTNGGFDADSDWNKAGSWTIEGGVANVTGSGVSQSITQVGIGIVNGKYNVSFDVAQNSLTGSGTAMDFPYTSGKTFTKEELSVGSHTFIITADTASFFNMRLRSGATGGTLKVDNISVVKVGQQRGNWKLDDGTGSNAIDSSGFDNHGKLIGYNSTVLETLDIKGMNNGTFVGGVLYNSTGVYSGRLDFDGVDDYVNVLEEVDYNFSDDINFSISLWANVNDDRLQSLISTKNLGTVVDGFLIYYDSTTNSIKAGLGEAPNLAIKEVNLNEWVHIVMLRKGNTTEIYLNNTKGTDGTNEDDNGNATRTLRFGYDLNAARRFKGSMDDVMIFNRTLSSAEIEDMYYKGRVNWQYGSEWENYSNSVESTISSSATNILPEFKYLSSPSNFYSPLAIGDKTNATADFVIFESQDSALPTITFESPTLDNGTRTRKTFADVQANISDNLGTELSSWMDFDNSLVCYWGMDNIGDVLTCDSAGTSYQASTQAYGTWEFDLYKGGDANTFSINFISDATAVNDGYRLRVGGVEALVLDRMTGGDNTVLMVTSSSYISINTWYRIKITRASDGEFTIYIKGGDFGIDYILADVSGGTNPTIENTHTSSVYSVLDIDADDKVGNYNLNESIALDLNAFTDSTGTYSFEETVLDSSSFDNFGSFVGGIGTNSTVLGKRGNALSFDGVDDTIGFSIINTSEMGNWSVSAWIKFYETNADDYPHVFGGYGLLVRNSTKKLGTHDGTGYFYSTGTITEGQWAHVVGTCNNATNTYTFYIDGSSSGSDTSYACGYGYSQRIKWIGSRTGSLSLWNGSIDEAMIFNRTLSQSEISALYDSKTNKFIANVTGLAEGQHNYSVYAIDEAGNLNISAERNLFVDTTKSIINFIYPNPLDEGFVDTSYVLINTTITDSSNTSAWIDWNNSLIGYWNFDNSNATGLFDNSSYLNFASFTGGQSTSDIIPGERGKALTFDGVDDEVNIGAGFTDQISTISIWFDSSVELSTSSGFYELVGFGSVKNSIFLGGSVSGNYANEFITFYTDTGTDISFYNETSGSIAVGWHHLVAVWETDRYNFYLDGVRKNASIFGTPEQITAIGLNLGDVTGVSGNFWNGSMDEVLIFNRSLSSSEISALYDNGVNRLDINITNLVDSSYNYSVHVIDEAGNYNFTTPDRQVTTDTVFPTISYIPQTPTDGSTSYSNEVNVNTTITDTNNLSAWIDWNETLVGYWNFDDVGDVLTCGSSGTSYQASTQAYGTWEFDLYKDTEAEKIYFIDSTTGTYPTSGTGYRITLNAQEVIQFLRMDGGTGTGPLFTTADSYVVINTWYRLKITRTTDGEFTAYIKGGIFGNDYVLVNVAGGSGSNPVTDNTYTSSVYSVLDLDAGDKVGNYNLNESIALDLNAFTDDTGTYSFEETVLDSSSFDNFGNFSGAAFGNSNITTGIRGEALEFDGSGDYVKATGSLGLSQTNFSGFAWINPSSYGASSNEQKIFGESYVSWEFEMEGDDELGFKFDSNASCYTATTGLNIPLNQWSFVGFNFNGGNLTFYYNENSQSINTTCDSTNAALTNFYVGARYVVSPSLFFNGSIDEVLIFNRTLSSSEISALYDNSVNRFDANFSNLLDGSYNYSVYAIDQAGNLNFTTPDRVIIENASVSVPTNVTWITTGGFTDDTLTFLQAIDYVNATCANATGSFAGCNMTLAKPDGTLVVNNSPMSVHAGDVWNYTTDISLNAAGNWTLNITSYTNYGVTNITSTSFNVSTANLSTTDGWYGCSNGTILTSAEIGNFANYECTLVELNESISNMSSAWNDVLEAVNNSKSTNLRVGLNFVLDFDYSDNASIINAGENVSFYFPNLTWSNYQIAIEYISFEITGSYSASENEDVLNNLSELATVAMENNFVVYSSNYNTSNLDNAYIQPSLMNHIDNQTEEAWIMQENNLMRSSTSLNRIYVGLNSTLLSKVQNFQNNIIDRLRAKPVSPSITEVIVGEMSNGDVVVFNNESTWRNIIVDINENTAVNTKDAWDDTNKLLTEKDNDLNFSVNVSGFSATYLLFEDLDHIQLSSNTAGTLYKQSAVVSQNYTYADGTNDGNWLVDNYADEIRWEGFDPFYKQNTFTVFYGWINYSSVTNWSAYEIVVLDDENPTTTASLIENTTTTDFYYYISVSDYENTAGWTSTKEAEVDVIIALNDSTRIHVFIDGLDSGIGGTNFSSRFKSLVDYIKVTKNRKVGINTYTAYEDFCTWSQPDGFCLKESCTRRWNGESAGAPTSYTWEDWGLEANKSTWYNSHNINVLCQSFDNRTTDTHEPLNWTVVQDSHFASLVLGYDDFFISQPDFNYAHTIYNYDAGDNLGQGYSTDDNETYYRRYSNGIVYFNTSSGRGWIEDGREIDVQVCFRLYDISDSPPDEQMNWEFRVNNISTTNVYDYTILGSDITAGVWNWYCTDLDESDESANGAYKIEATTSDTGTAGDGIYVGWENVADTGVHSWYSNSAGDPTWTAYAENQNWEVRVVVNETKKASIDTLASQITQTNTTSQGYVNLTITSATDYDLEVWSNVVNVTGYSELSYHNGTEFVILNASSTSTCNTNNPTWTTNTVNSETHEACIYTTGDYTLVRVATPHLSTQIYNITVNDTDAPQMNFVSPTENNDAYKRDTFVYANLSITESNLVNTTYYLFNNTYYPSNGLAGYWKLNGNGNDSSGQGNDGTLKNGATGAVDNYSLQNGSISFDGVDDYVDLDTNTYGLNSGSSFSFWAKTTDSSNFMNILSGANSLSRISLIGSTGAFYFETDTNGDDVSKLLPANWNNGDFHLFTAISNNYNVSLYFDGSYLVSGVVLDNLTISVIGSGTTLGTYPFNGSIDEVLFYNRILSSAEITNLYTHGLMRKNLSVATSFNWTSLGEGVYDYFVVANDTNGNVNSTALRNITLDTTKAVINFISPTPSDKGFVDDTYVLINTTIADSSNTSAWIDWNKSVVGYWNFDNYNATGFFDNSSYSRFGSFAGVNFGTSNISTGKRGYGLDFDGVDDYVGLTSFNITSNSSLSFWAKIGAKDYQGIVGRNGGSFSYFRFGNNVGTYDNNIYGETFTDGDVISLDFKDSFNEISLDTWYYFTIVQDDNLNWSLYINGIYQSSDITTNSIMEIGRIGSARTSDWFNGTMDEVLIFNRTLSQSEISALYDDGANRLDVNISGLSSGLYNYSVYAIDQAGNLNFTTPDRQVTVDLTAPILNWVAPTYSNGNSTLDNFTYLNVTVTDSSNTSAWFDWNKSLVGYWSFEDYSATGIFDNSTYSNFGSFAGGLSTTNISTGRFGSALEFDGVDDYVSTSTINIGINHSVSAWIYWKEPANVGEYQAIQGYSGDTYMTNLMLKDDAGNVDLFYHNGVSFSIVDSGLATMNDAWYHLVSTRENSNISFYINGVYVGSDDDGFTNEMYVDRIGAREGGSNDFWFNGSIDELLIFNRTLSTSEISALYDNSANRLENNFTDLSEAEYNYSAYVIDAGGNLVIDDYRTLIIDWTYPVISFINPNPADGSSVNENFVVLNTTIIDSNDGSAWIDWNKSLVGYWGMDSFNSTGVFDNSSYGNNGTFNGVNFGISNITNGKRGRALEFDGVDDYVDLGSDFMGLGNMTISAWIYPKGWGESNQGRIVVNNQNAVQTGFLFSIKSSSSRLQFVGDDTGDTGVVIYSAVSSIELNKWQHVLITRNSTGFVNFYIDGALSGTPNQYAGTPSVGTTNVIIGSTSTPLRNFNGSIDEVLIFNRTLSSNEILALYDNGANRLDVNYSNLADRTYNYSVYVIDSAGNLNFTSPDRQVTVDQTSPTIAFVNPTSKTGTINEDFTYVNVSISGASSTVVDWNGSLVSWWRFEGDVNDQLGTNNGTNNGATATYAGKFGEGYEFDGVGDYVQHDKISFARTDSWTWSGWLDNKFSDGSVFFAGDLSNLDFLVLRYSADHRFGIRNSTGIYILLDSSTSEFTYQTGWQHVVFVANGLDSLSVYGNGSLIGTASGGTGMEFESMGQAYVSTLYNFNGSIDEVMIFNRSLSSDEILSIYNATAYEHNFTDLSELSSQNLKAYSVDDAGNLAQTSLRTIKTDFTNPVVNFTAPTPDDNGYSTVNYVTINATVTDSSDISAWVDWNRSLVGYWAMDYYNSTVVFDNSSYGNNGTFNGGIGTANITTGARGKALEFDGVDDYVELDNMIQLSDSNNWSVSAWINYNDVTDIQLPILSGRIFAVYNNKLRYYDSEFGTSYSSSMNELVWNQVSFVCANTAGTFYINGVESGIISANCSSSYAIATRTNRIGWDVGSLYFNGSIDEVLIFNRSLSTDEISALYNSTANNYLGNFTSLIEGATYNYTTWVVDEAGNLNLTDDRSVTIDTIFPTVTITAPTVSQIFTSASVSFGVTTSENSTCEYSLDEGVTNYSLAANTIGTGHTATRTLTNANYVSNVYCSDLAGNQNNSENVSFTVAVAAVVTEDTGGGGGGGGAAAPVFKPAFEFELTPENYEKTVALNRIEFDKFTITNLGDLDEEYDFEVIALEDLLSLDVPSIEVVAKDSRDIEFKLTSPKETGIYTGKIVATSGTLIDEILVTINVKTEKSLFDIILTLPDRMREIRPGHNLETQIDLLQMGLKEKMDVTLHYVIKDFNGNTLLTESETIAVYDQKTHYREFYTKELASGDYVLGIELIYPDGVAVASSQFKVKDEFQWSLQTILMFSLLFAVAFVFVAISLLIKRYKKLAKHLKSKKKAL